MECEKCGDKGFIEKEHGLVMEFCDCEKGQALRVEKIGEVPKTENVFTGLLFHLTGKRTDEYSDDELWLMAKKEAEGKALWPHIVRMPCGNEQRFDSFSDLPVEDISCPCGNPDHYIVRFIDNREVIDDNSDSGTGPDNKPTGSEDTSKPKKSRKRKAGKKSRKGTRKILQKA